MSHKSASRKREAPVDYESDDGFVEDAPKSKKSKKGDFKANSQLQTDDEGNEFWEVSQFKGSTMVGIREFYEKDGKMLPGKKGISLTIDQYTALVEVLPQIHNVLKSKGVYVPNPQFDGPSKPVPMEAESDGEGNIEDNSDSMDDFQSASVSKEKLDKLNMRGNHEATSDEED